MSNVTEIRGEQILKERGLAVRRRYRSKLLRQYAKEEPRPKGVVFAFTPDGFEFSAYNGELGAEFSSTWSQLYEMFSRKEEEDGQAECTYRRR